jgi:hypothetical protein
MADETAIRDPTEPDPVTIGATLFEESPYMWNVELYLMSKYYPEFVESTIFKIRAAAMERAKIVKEDHLIHKSVSSLQNAIEMDLVRNVQWTPQKSHKSTGRAVSPGIGKQYQRDLESL